MHWYAMCIQSSSVDMTKSVTTAEPRLSKWNGRFSHLRGMTRPASKAPHASPISGSHRNSPEMQSSLLFTTRLVPSSRSMTASLHCQNLPPKSCTPRMEKTMNSKAPKATTLSTDGMERMSALTTICIPLRRDIMRSGLSARIRRNVRMMVSESSFRMRLKRLVVTMMASRMFQPLLRYAPGCSTTPDASTLMSSSTVNTMVKMLSMILSTFPRSLSLSTDGLSTARSRLLMRMRNRIVYSNGFELATLWKNILNGFVGWRQKKARYLRCSSENAGSTSRGSPVSSEYTILLPSSFIACFAPARAPAPLTISSTRPGTPTGRPSGPTALKKSSPPLSAPMLCACRDLPSNASTTGPGSPAAPGRSATPTASSAAPAAPGRSATPTSSAAPRASAASGSPTPAALGCSAATTRSPAPAASAGAGLGTPYAL
mmetsp:Transcript_2794/g.9850  ORF Transcript_2794/g.9850 Transcript_2794/m.9850 type:complete len:430 (+) Transcript_2794:2656-3945(+)